MIWRGGQNYCKFFYKTAVYAAWGVEWSGSTLTCSDQCASIVCLPASVEKKRENSFCLEKEKCFAVRSAHESKVSVQLFQFKSRLDSPRVLHNDSRERGFFYTGYIFRKIHPGFFHMTHCDLSTNQCSLFFRLNTFTIRPFFFFFLRKGRRQLTFTIIVIYCRLYFNN